MTVPHKYLLIKLQHLLDFLVFSEGNVCVSLNAMVLLLQCKAIGLPAACWCQLGLCQLWRELGLEKCCGLRFVILPSHFLFFYPLVRSCSGTVGQDTANQVKDLSGKGECPCWGRQQEVPRAIEDRCGKGTGSAERGVVHTINLNFSPFTKLVSTEAIPDFPLPTQWCYFALDSSQGMVHSL